MWRYNYGSELYHHGIKGMKWGVRRYQNADSSLTEAGKKRRAKDFAKLNKVYGKTENLRYNYEQAEKEAKKKGPTHYGRWYTTGKNTETRRLIKQRTKRVNKLISKISDKYPNQMAYNVQTGQYVVSEFKKDGK